MDNSDTCILIVLQVWPHLFSNLPISRNPHPPFQDEILCDTLSRSWDAPTFLALINTDRFSSRCMQWHSFFVIDLQALLQQRIQKSASDVLMHAT